MHVRSLQIIDAAASIIRKTQFSIGFRIWAWHLVASLPEELQQQEFRSPEKFFQSISGDGRAFRRTSLFYDRWRETVAG